MKCLRRGNVEVPECCVHGGSQVRHYRLAASFLSSLFLIFPAFLKWESLGFSRALFVSWHLVSSRPALMDCTFELV